MTSWTPFDCLVVASQTQAGLLEKEPNEVDVLVMEGIELRSANTEPMVPLNEKNQVDVPKSSGTWIDRTTNDITVQITTHRTVFWKSNQANNTRFGRFLHHSQIILISPESAYFRSPKLLLNTAALGDLYLVFPKDKTRLRDDCLASLEKALARKEWERNNATATGSGSGSSMTKKSTASTRRVGVDAILTQNARRHQQAAKLTDTAFQGDAETLLHEAADLVQIIHKYVATLDRQQEGVSSDGNDNDDTDQLMGMLRNMGMTSALSKDNFAGRAYTDQVARELVDFLHPKFSPQHPCITLTDVYCLFNRARGSHLLSPADLRQAAVRCSELKLGLSLHTFPSGLVVLQDDNHANPERMAERLQDLLQQTNESSLTAVDVSRQWRISAVLALEQLQAVERMCYLVRDETLETLRFYPNRFNEWI